MYNTLIYSKFKSSNDGEKREEEDAISLVSEMIHNKKKVGH